MDVATRGVAALRDADRLCPLTRPCGGRKATATSGGQQPFPICTTAATAARIPDITTTKPSTGRIG